MGDNEGGAMKNYESQQEMTAKLHATDRRAAKEAVAFFVEQRLSAPLVERLKAGDDDVRIDAVRGLAAIGDQSAVPALADLLEAEARPVKGSETATLQEILKETALEAVTALTGESFDLKDVHDQGAVRSIVERIRARHGQS